jgi:sodium/hydrogen antiporter
MSRAPPFCPGRGETDVRGHRRDTTPARARSPGTADGVDLNGVLTVVGAAVLGFALLSELLRRLWLSVPLAATTLGVVLGPEVLGALPDVPADRDARKIVEEVARITLAFSLTSVGLQITRGDLRACGRPAVLLLAVAMPGMWAVTGLGAWLLLDVPFWVGMLIGAVLTPTDPVVASALVSGPMAEANLPRRLRRTLQLESGANDGLALPFVLLPVAALAEAGPIAGGYVGDVAVQLGIAIGAGLVLGVAAARLLGFSIAREGVERPSFSAAGIGLAVLALGATHLLGGSGVLAAFVAGLTFSLAAEEEHVADIAQSQSAVERVFLVAVFVLFGALLPWQGWQALGWATVIAFAGWALLARRPLVVAAALQPARLPRPDVAFLAWFGPIGVAAIYYVLSIERHGIDGYDTILAAATAGIAASVVVHSVTATPLARRHAGRSATGTARHPLRRTADEAP